jgi:very-short-patch-repair endonuclease
MGAGQAHQAAAQASAQAGHCTRSGRTGGLADHALTLNRIDDVRAITSRAIQRRRCTLDDLGKELEDGPRNGSALLREALTDVGYGAWSAPEARAARSLRKARLGPFEQNAKVIGPLGETYFVDFLWRELRAVLEIDSREFHFDEPEWKQTQIRHRKLETVGYSAVHMPPSEVKNEAQFIFDVGLWLAGRAHSLGLTFADHLINIPQTLAGSGQGDVDQAVGRIGSLRGD